MQLSQSFQPLHRSHCKEQRVQDAVSYTTQASKRLDFKCARCSFAGSAELSLLVNTQPILRPCGECAEVGMHLGGCHVLQAAWNSSGRALRLFTARQHTNSILCDSRLARLNAGTHAPGTYMRRSAVLRGLGVAGVAPKFGSLVTARRSHAVSALSAACRCYLSKLQAFELPNNTRSSQHSRMCLCAWVVAL